MSVKEVGRPDSPTLAADSPYPDSPTLAPDDLNRTPTSQTFSSASSSWSSPSFASRPRKARRAVSVLGGVLWSEEGAKRVPKVEDLYSVYDDALESPLSLENPVAYSREDNLVQDPRTIDEDEWNGNSRATSRTNSSRGSIEQLVDSFPDPKDIERRITMTKKVPSPLILEKRTISGLSNISVLSSPPATPDLDSPTTPAQNIPFDARLRIKHAVAKAKERALENLQKREEGKKLISLKEWQDLDAHAGDEELNDCIANAWEEHAATIGLRSKNPRKHVDWHKKKNRFAPLRYSVAFPKIEPKRSSAEMRAQINELDPDGSWSKYKTRVNSLRLAKMKQMFGPSILRSLKQEAEKSGKPLHPNIEDDVEALFMALNLKKSDPRPTPKEMLQVLTPIQDGFRLPPGPPASASDPFASLYHGRLAIAAFENDVIKTDTELAKKRRKSNSAGEEEAEEPDLPKITRKVKTRFITHNAVQARLREAWRERDKDMTAVKVASDALKQFWDKMADDPIFMKDAPLATELRDEEGHVLCELQEYHYIVAYLTAFMSRCERYGW
jgi:hypothetical protein